MEERTRLYLRGRFSDHYRRTSIAPPPDASEREWGFIPWTAGPGTTMVRHRSLLDLGDLEDFLTRKRPRHVYFSAGQYDDPGAQSMNRKGWRGSDLVFDLDADHLPRVDPETDSYASMLSTCKDALLRLLSFLETDFGFEDPTVVFSGGRGYHVHVRDEGVRSLDREDRREIVDYVRGIDVDFDRVLSREAVGGLGRKTPADKRTLDTRGGWSRRVHQEIVAAVDRLIDLPADDAREHLQSYDGIGPDRAAAIYRAATENYDAIAAGNVDVHSAFFTFARTIAEAAIEDQAAPIDEPVTTDVNRLIRLPGSLHGGSGLEVQRIDRGDLEAFDPLVDAVPATFRGSEIRVEVTEGGEVELGGDTFTVPEGAQTVPEYLGVFLMARGRAEKERETET